MTLPLDQRLLQAHEAGDDTRLIGLYIEAADQAADVDAASFYLTHAYVFALQTGDRRAYPINARLVAHGRDVPLPDNPLL